MLGYANVDVIARVERMPCSGDRVTSAAIDLLPGGMAANCACAAAQLGATTELLASIGTDALAKVLLDDLALRGVGTRHLHRGGRTTKAVITVTPDGERSIISEPVAYHEASVRAALEERAGERCLLYLDGYHLGRARREVERARELGFLVYCDLDGAPDTYRSDEVENVLNHVSVAQWNPVIARSWLPGRDERGRLAWLAERVGTVVTTQGAAGVVVTIADESMWFPVPVVDSVRDTTGAGDIFAGAMLYRLALGETVVQAVPAAIRVASTSVRHVGARLPLSPTRPS